MSEQTNKGIEEEKLKEHSYDGIREYDKRLPNWWLWTLYLAMIFSFGYWFAFHRSAPMESADERLQHRLLELARQASASGGELTDDLLWQMSEDPGVLASGKATFDSTCASCHGENLQGGIGFNLADSEWVHGGQPTEIANTVINGVLDKGMPAWGAVLGQSRISEVVAYILSHHPREN